MVLFSHLTLQLPSLELSQKQELAVCNPAPFFCMITHVTENKIKSVTKNVGRICQLTYVLERLLEFGQGCQAWLDHGVGPLAHFRMGVAVRPNGDLDCLLDNVGHFVHNKLGLERQLSRSRTDPIRENVSYLFCGLIPGLSRHCHFEYNL